MGQVTGYVYDTQGSPKNGIKVRLYRRDNGQFLSSATSGSISTELGLIDFTMDNISGSTLLNENAAYDNGSITGCTFSAGKTGNAVFFSGASDIISVPDSPELRPSSFSISLWIKYTSTDNLVIVEKGTSNNCWSLQTLTGAQFAVGSLGWVVGGTATYVKSNGGNNDNLWHHVVCTYEPNVGKIYIDGVDSTNSTVNATPTYAAEALTLGARTGGTGLFATGGIDSFKFFDRVLTAQEITDLYANEGASLQAGEYQINTTYSGECNVLFLDDDAGTQLNDIVHRVVVV